MKTTIDIPDELYRQIKAKSALEGRAVREVTIELYRKWLSASHLPAPDETLAEGLRAWFEMADRAVENAPPGPSAREILSEDRDHLEPK